MGEDNGLLQVDPLYENKMGELEKGAFWRIFQICTYISKIKNWDKAMMMMATANNYILKQKALNASNLQTAS